MLIGDTFFPLFGLDQDRICFISEIALDCAMVRLENIHITFDPHPNRKKDQCLWECFPSVSPHRPLFPCDEIS